MIKDVSGAGLNKIKFRKLSQNKKKRYSDEQWGHKQAVWL
jgi:hypothetical protein